MRPPLLEVRSVGMTFGSISALHDVSLRIEAGSVTCLIGDNGAGKSTLIRILSGVHKPTSGEYLVEGEPVRLNSPVDARKLGIATVHQDLALIPLLAIWRNFFLGSELTRGRGVLRRLDVARSREVARAALAELGVQLHSTDQPVGTLSGGERQTLAIARALHFGARVLILDEPTAALGVKQAGIVLRAISHARERGLAVVFITHNPAHALAVGDRFTILQRGHVAAEYGQSDVTLAALTRGMSGEGPLET